MFSIVIPIYNEEKSIANTINKCNEISKQLEASNSEIIAVNDASTDNTLTELKKYNIEIINHPVNAGYGRSLKDGIKKAKNDTIIIIDADGTYPIEYIPELLEIYNQGLNMVVGSRQGKHLNESVGTRILRNVLKSIVEFTAGQKIPDINSGMRIFSKKEITEYLDSLCDSFSFTTSLTLAYLMTGKFVKYTPIKYYKRKGKSKVKIFKDSLRTMQFITEAILYYNPIKLFLVFSILFIIFSFVDFTIAVILNNIYLYIIGVIILISSVFVFCMGLIAVLIKQILHKK